ncbi:MAG: aminoacyl-tRNA hydrolase [Puniceicoccales bacterium]|jgi:PTH1 family peptidyl-tRNA hydrolase|nr:aminoacyl-tRNA hydrolase [Puniceicoccales bacterium]
MALDVIVGLGNEGGFYRNTRHNIGVHFIDACRVLIASHQPWRTDAQLHCFYADVDWCGRRCYLVKPMGFMNESGRGLQLWLSFFKRKSTNMVLCCDDITVPLGDVKVTFRPGSAGHRGVEDVLSRVGPGFVRFRLGIGPKQHPEMDLKDHVLGRFSESEQACIDGHLSSWVTQLELLLDKKEIPSINPSS